MKRFKCKLSYRKVTWKHGIKSHRTEDKAIRSLVKVIHPLEFPHSHDPHSSTNIPIRITIYQPIASRRQLQSRPSLKSRSNEWNEITISSPLPSFRNQQIRNPVAFKPVSISHSRDKARPIWTGPLSSRF